MEEILWMKSETMLNLLRKSRHLVWRVDLDSSTDQDILIQFVVSIGLSVVD